MWGLGNSETVGNGCPKTVQESSLWVISGNVQCRKIEPNRPTLQECLDDGEIIVGQSPSSSRTLDDAAPSVKASAAQKKAVVYRGAAGDRTYTELAPTLRSLANTGGKHQGGGGAWKVVEYKGEDYLVSSQFPEDACSLASTCSHLRSGARPRKLKDGLAALIPISYRRHRPLSATEFERLMGWPVGCTEKGITRDGKEITISKTQRQKMLGNGIIPHEIEDICHKLKPILAFPSPDSQPEPRSPEEESPSDLNSGKPKNLDGINSPRSSLAGCVL